MLARYIARNSEACGEFSQEVAAIVGVTQSYRNGDLCLKRLQKSLELSIVARLPLPTSRISDDDCTGGISRRDL